MLGKDETRARLLCAEYGHNDPAGHGFCLRCGEVTTPVNYICLKAPGTRFDGRWIDKGRVRTAQTPRDLYGTFGEITFCATDERVTNDEGQVALVYQAEPPVRVTDSYLTPEQRDAVMDPYKYKTGFLDYLYGKGGDECTP